MCHAPQELGLGLTVNTGAPTPAVSVAERAPWMPQSQAVVPTDTSAGVAPVTAVPVPSRARPLAMNLPVQLRGPGATPTNASRQGSLPPYSVPPPVAPKKPHQSSDVPPLPPIQWAKGGLKVPSPSPSPKASRAPLRKESGAANQQSQGRQPLFTGECFTTPPPSRP